MCKSFTANKKLVISAKKNKIDVFNVIICRFPCTMFIFLSTIWESNFWYYVAKIVPPNFFHRGGVKIVPFHFLSRLVSQINKPQRGDRNSYLRCLLHPASSHIIAFEGLFIWEAGGYENPDETHGIVSIKSFC